MSDFLPIGIGLLSGIAVFLAAWYVMATLAKRNQTRVIRSMSRYSTGRAGGASANSQPQESAQLLSIGRRLVQGSYLRFLSLKLQQAGQFGAGATDTLLVRKVLFGAIGFGLGILSFGRGLSFGASMMLLLTLVGFFVPDLLTVSKGQNRVQAIEQSLPDAIDLLSLCVESGLSFDAAAARVSVSMDGPVAEEFGALIGEIQLGKSRSEALVALTERSKSAGLNRVASALLQVDRLGIPISAVLQELASEMRKTRKDLAREQAQKVTVKILAPLMVCLLPAVFIVVIGPALVTLFTGLGSLE